MSFNLRDHCHVNSNDDGDRFVGVKADSDNVVVYFPLGYELPRQDDELRRDIKNLFNVLAIFTDKTNRILERNSLFIPQTVEFPIQAYLNIINYYLDHNGTYYTENKFIYQIGKSGKLDWGKTVRKITPMIQKRSFVYLNQVCRSQSSDINHLITRIHKYCVYHSFERIGWLYTTNTPEIPDILFDKTLFVTALNSKLANTNNDNDKQLFRSMIAMIDFEDAQTTDKDFYFGTDNFETVWEKLVDCFFGISNKQSFFPHAKWTERFGKNKGRPASALEPDSIMIYNDKYYVLDAKYYRYGIFPEYGTHFLPQSSDVNKQITYGQYVKINNKTKLIYNAFIMPYNRRNNFFGMNEFCENVAEATGDWIENPKDYEKIQGIVIDTRYMLKNYDGCHDADKALLSIAIEKGFQS